MSAIVGTGIIFRVLPRTPYSFSNLVVGTPAMTIFVAQHIDVSPFQEVDLVVRTHTATITSTATVVVSVVADGFTEEDPTNSFFGGMTNYTVPAGTGVAGYGVTSIPSPFGRLLTVAVSGMQVASGGAATITATLSIDLVCKSGDPSGIQPAYNTYRGYR